MGTTRPFRFGVVGTPHDIVEATDNLLFGP